MEYRLTYSQIREKKVTKRQKKSVLRKKPCKQRLIFENGSKSMVRRSRHRILQERKQNSLTFSKNRRKAVAKKKNDNYKLQKFLLSKHKKRAEKLKRKCELKSILKIKSKEAKNRYKNQVKIHPKNYFIKTLIKNKQLKRGTLRTKSSHSKLQHSDFMLNSIFFAEKNVTIKNANMRKLEEERLFSNKNFLLQKGFKINNKAKRQNVNLSKKNRNSKIKFNRISLYNFVSIKSIENLYYDFKEICNGRLCFTFSAKDIFSDEKVFIKVYETNVIKSPLLIDQFQVILH